MSRRKQERSKPLRIILRPLPSHEPVKTFFPDSEIFYADIDSRLDKFDGALNEEGNGIGLVLLSPDSWRSDNTQSFSVFPTTNNVPEYEAFIAGQQAALQLDARHLQFLGDSKLVSDRWMEDEKEMRPYQELARDFGTRPDVMFGIWWPDARKYKREHSTHWWAARLRRLMPSPRSERIIEFFLSYLY